MCCLSVTPPCTWPPRMCTWGRSSSCCFGWRCRWSTVSSPGRWHWTWTRRGPPACCPTPGRTAARSRRRRAGRCRAATAGSCRRCTTPCAAPAPWRTRWSPPARRGTLPSAVSSRGAADSPPSSHRDWQLPEQRPNWSTWWWCDREDASLRSAPRRTGEPQREKRLAKDASNVCKEELFTEREKRKALIITALQSLSNQLQPLQPVAPASLWKKKKKKAYAKNKQACAPETEQHESKNKTKL